MKVMIGLFACTLLFVTPLVARPATPEAEADLYNANRQKIGHATLKEAKGGVQIHLNITQLPPGTHALHIHSAGRCDLPDFTSAGPHFNPADKKHGTKNPEGPHAGDLPNFVVGKDGHAKLSILASGVTLGEGDNSLFHPEGTSLIVHEQADDYMTDPAGNAGARIACGVIRK